MRVMSANRFERFFRIEARLNVDKTDLKRHNEFINHKIYDLLVRAEAAAKANGRDIIQPFDLPITKGLQERVHEFRLLDQDVELQPVLDDVVALPPLDLACAADTEARLPEIAGGLSLALARTFKIIDPDLENPSPSTGSARSASSTSCCEEHDQHVRLEAWDGAPVPVLCPALRRPSSRFAGGDARVAEVDRLGLLEIELHIQELQQVAQRDDADHPIALGHQQPGVLGAGHERQHLHGIHLRTDRGGLRARLHDLRDGGGGPPFARQSLDVIHADAADQASVVDHREHVVVMAIDVIVDQLGDGDA